MSERLTDPWIRSFLDSRDVLMLGTIEADGSPLLTPMWFWQEPVTLVMVTLAGSRKVANVMRDARVAVVGESGTREDIRRVTIVGRAEIVPDSAERRRLAEQFLTKYHPYVEQRWRGRRLPADRAMLQIVPSSVRSWGLMPDAAHRGRDQATRGTS